MDMNANQDDLNEKQNIYYSAIVNAYIESSMERDRSLLNLSAGGIGLLVTLMTTVGVRSTCELLLYIASSVTFGSAIVLILHVFKLNKVYLLKLVKNELTIEDNKLKRFDNAIYVLFISGVALLFSIGIFATINQLTSKEKGNMSDDNKKEKRIIESVQDLSKLRPDSTDGKKSLQGLADLKPKKDSGTKTDSSSSSSSDSKK